MKQEDIDAFRSEITSNIQTRGIRIAFEEMHETEVDGDETVCQSVCSSLGIPARFVDLSRKERECLAIDPWLLEEEIERVKAEPGDAWIEIEDLKKEPNVFPFTTQIIAPVRERVWVARIRKEDTWPALFICGADHVQSICQPFGAIDIRAEVLCSDFPDEIKNND